MKRAGKMIVCIAAALTLNAGLRAGGVVLPGNPYAPVIVRNVFALNPPTPPAELADVQPPVKITPDGIMSIFGHLQVLFKVAAKAGSKEQSYILAQGQRQDDIEVTKIDEKKGLVTFNNHGLVQELPLANATATATATTIPAPARNFGFYRSAGGNSFGGRRRSDTGTDNANDSSNLRGIPTRTIR